MNTVYISGRIQKQRKRNTNTPVSARAKSVIDAVTKTMREELSEAAWMRWCSRVNSYIGSNAFHPSGNEADAGDIVAPVPQVWCPSKPKLALALLNELDRSDMSDSATSSRTASPCVGTERHITKVLARRIIESMREDKGLEWLEACGELTDAQLKDPAKLSQTLARVAFDVFVFMHVRAMEKIGDLIHTPSAPPRSHSAPFRTALCGRNRRWALAKVVVAASSGRPCPALGQVKGPPRTLHQCPRA